MSYAGSRGEAQEPSLADTVQQSSAAIGIICKTPIPGASKTRLVPVLGMEGAAGLAAAFLSDVAAAIEMVPASCARTGYAVYAPEGTEEKIRPLLPPGFGLVCRRGSTLEHVLYGATRELLERGHDAVVLINGDSPTLPPLTIAAAIAALRRPGDRVVLGPAHDGGYYLIGLKVAHRELFRDIPWSTPAVLEATLEQARRCALAVELLPLWYDVDDVETLQVLVDEIATGVLPFDHGGLQGGPARATRAFLATCPTVRARPDIMLGTGP
jgi:rSAM/selenodomain-associated transferase 1